ncbi:hypothetical protein CRM22_004365 [Opisthorchis felineus]|uniref:Selenoprotein O n=1 Tax=Opisthorchis felineus TaxID=147828 RepID=A0A4S2LWI5_OPIFE|nr:hypothetical protein CRM22_004365 [Opisthorchis felineus]TGZ68225.1 hypothetical protein CRM22_004365 [Opisthorchis felineus]
MTDAIQRIHRGPDFDNLALRVLPVDTGPNVVRQVANACFARVMPTPVESPCLVVASREVCHLLDLPVPEEIDKSSEHYEAFIKHLSGNLVWPLSEPAAHCYCGHQFGTFAGQLGDGAVIYLGEVVNQQKERWELQLKGAGPTPFSRSADGRKVLRSSLREFLCSEAMYHLGVPTTRALSVVTSDTRVPRDVLYTGKVILERASITARVAPTFIRFGSFEITKPSSSSLERHGPSVGNHTIVSQLTAYVIENFYPAIWQTQDLSNPVALYLDFFEQVVKRTAELVACWQTFGFCHGVLNTDNMSILGLTIDYGPFGFIDRFMWDHVCNASDTDGRYSYAQQPSICAWNCARLAECLARAVMDVRSPPGQSKNEEPRKSQETELMQHFMDRLATTFIPTFQQCYVDKMRKKLGLLGPPAMGTDESDEQLFKSLFDTMEQTGADFTNTFIVLEETVESAASIGVGSSEPICLSPDIVVQECCSLDELMDAYEPSSSEIQQEMLLRFTRFGRQFFDRLNQTKVLKPEEKTARRQALQNMSEADKSSRDRALWKIWLDAYAERLSHDIQVNPEASIADRLKLMRSVNPRIVLRNYMAEEAIRAAESGDFAVVRQLLDDLRRPYLYPDHQPHRTRFSEQPSEGMTNEVDASGSHTRRYAVCHRVRPPEWARELRVT